MFPSRRAVCLLIFLCYVIVQECKGDGYDPAPKCKTRDCPTYNVIYTSPQFEIRNYSQALWMSSPTLPQDSAMAAFSIGTLRLDDFYRGKNAQGVRIELTSPALIDVFNSLYTVYYYVPKKYQNGSLPKPLSSEIKQVTMPKHKYAAVRRFSDEFVEKTIAVEFDALKKNLQGTAYQRAADLNSYALAIYDESSFSQGNVYEVLIWFD